MEIKSVVEDGVHVFAVAGRANIRRRYRMQRVTGTVTSFFPDKAGNRRWRALSPGMSHKIRRAIAEHYSLWLGQPAQRPRLVFSR
jgi:hypothetical protein